MSSIKFAEIMSVVILIGLIYFIVAITNKQMA